MQFLAINTAGAAVEAALYKGEGRSLYRADTEFKKASSVLFRFIDELLTEAGVELRALDFIAVVTGPGSFTGIRIGLAAARSLAQFSGLRLVPVTYAEVLSYNECVSNAQAERIVTLSDASNGWVYGAVLDKNREVIVPPAALRYDRVPEFLAGVEEPYVICPDAAIEKLIAPLAKTVFSIKAGGEQLAMAALSAYQKRHTVPYGQAVPVYVRQSQAEEGLAERDIRFHSEYL